MSMLALDEESSSDSWVLERVLDAITSFLVQWSVCWGWADGRLNSSENVLGNWEEGEEESKEEFGDLSVSGVDSHSS